MASKSKTEEAPAPVITEWDAKAIENELDDMKATLRDFEDKDLQEVADLSSTARVLANAIDTTFSKLGGLQDELWTKIRNIEDRLKS